MSPDLERFAKIDIDDSVQVRKDIYYCPKTYFGKYRAIKNYLFYRKLRDSGLKWREAIQIAAKECNAAEITVRKQITYAKEYFKELEKKKNH